MQEPDFLGSGWAFPIAVLDGTITVAEETTLIQQSIWVILGTAKGERVMRPDFGCGIWDLVFAPNNSATAALAVFYVKEALLQWEPRIEVGEVRSKPDPDREERLDIEIAYWIKASNTPANLVYPFYLEGRQ